MTAGNRIRYFFVAFYVDPRIDRFALERICHILFAGVCKRTVIFAKMASKTPLFIYIDSFHDVYLILPRGIYRVSATPCR